MKKIIYALRFMTILPLPWRKNEDLVQVSRSSGMFPLVGLVIGIALAVLGKFSPMILSPDITAFLQTLFWIFLTGGLHLDGLSDTFDGLGSGRERERMLEIMKDSSIGAFGALSLILQILFKFLFIREINAVSPWLVLLPPITGRWGQLIGIYFYPSARKNGMGIFFKDHIRLREVFIGLGTTLIVLGFTLPFSVFILLIHSLLIVFIAKGVTKKLGGLTGDVYGLICETGESITLLLLVFYISLFPGSLPFQAMNNLIHSLF